MQMHYHSGMMSVLEAKSTLTERYQTTIPAEVRHALKLRRRDKIHFLIRRDGTVTLVRATRAGKEADPVLGAFLRFLAGDISSHPRNVQGLDKSLVNRIRSLTHGVKVNLDAPLAKDE